MRWFRNEGRSLPWREEPTGYRVLVSEFMLQQTQVVTVEAYFERWMKKFPDFATLAAASEEEVLSLWQGLGYYARCRNLRKAAIAVMEHHGGRLPQKVEELRRLPGVGPYTAAAICAFSFDQPLPVLDANIMRVLARLEDFRAPIDQPVGRRGLSEIATRLLPARTGGRAFTSALMDLGAMICKPGVPECNRCPVRSCCQAESPAPLPVKAPRRSTEFAEDRVLWIASKTGILLSASSGGRWKGLWRLPPAPSHLSLEKPIHRSRYSILHYRMDLLVFPGKTPTDTESTRLVRWKDLAVTPIPSPHRRAIDLLGRDMLGIDTKSGQPRF